jgi:hypothetical protein
MYMYMYMPYYVTSHCILLRIVLSHDRVHVLIVATVVYALLVATKDVRALDSWRHFIIIFFVMVYMFTIHFHHIYYRFLVWELDISMPMMMLTIKVWLPACMLHIEVTCCIKLIIVISLPFNQLTR